NRYGDLRVRLYAIAARSSGRPRADPKARDGMMCEHSQTMFEGSLQRSGRAPKASTETSNSLRCSGMHLLKSLVPVTRRPSMICWSAAGLGSADELQPGSTSTRPRTRPRVHRYGTLSRLMLRRYCHVARYLVSPWSGGDGGPSPR